MFLAARLRLRCQSPLVVDAVSAEYAHGAINALVATVDPGASALAHTTQGFLGTSGPLVDGLPPLSPVALKPGDEFTLRASAAGEAVCKALLEALSRNCISLILGPIDPKMGPQVTCDVVASLMEERTGSNRATFRDLCDEAAREAEGPMRMHFISPTSFKRRSTWLALPTPELVFGDAAAERPRGLAGKWAAMGGPPLPGGFSGAVLGCTPIEISPRTIRTHTSLRGHRGRPAPVRGFVGSCDYFATDSETRAAMWALGRFASSVGVGYKPAMGLGWVEVERAQ